MADSLIVKLGADTSEFKGALNQAANSTEDLKHSANELGEALEHLNEKTGRLQHRLLEGFIGYEAIMRIKEWGIESVKAAQETREQFEKLHHPIDDATRSLAAFGDGLDVVKHGTISAVGSVLSFFTRAGEGWGMLINRIRGVSKETEKSGEETSKAAAEQEKKLAEAIKAHADDAKKAEEIEKQLAENSYKRGLALLNINEQIAVITAKKTELEEKLASITTNSDSDRLRKAQLRLEIDKKQEEIDQKKAEHDKQNAEALEQFNKDMVALNEKLAKAKYDLLKPDQQLIELQKQLVQANKEVNNQHATEEDHKKALIKLATIQKEIADKQLEVQKQINKETQHTADILSGGAKGDIGVIKSISGFRTYNNAAEQKDYERGLIAQARSEIQDQIDEIQGKIDAYLKSGSTFGSYEIGSLRERLSALQSRKQNADQFVFNPNYSDKIGQGIFASQVSQIGDPLGLQKKQTDTLQTVAQGINEINNRLRVAGLGTSGG